MRLRCNRFCVVPSSGASDGSRWHGCLEGHPCVALGKDSSQETVIREKRLGMRNPRLADANIGQIGRIGRIGRIGQSAIRNPQLKGCVDRSFGVQSPSL
jgi:hypothetical protein